MSSRFRHFGHRAVPMRVSRLNALLVGASLVVSAAVPASGLSGAQATEPDLAVEEPHGITPPAPRLDAEVEWLQRHRTPAARRAARTAADGGTFSTTSVDDIGGDDAIIAAAPNMRISAGWSMDIAENGDIYAAVEVVDALEGGEIRVYRSQDGGTEWTLWGTRGNADPAINYHTPSIHVAEGTQDRVYVAYQFESGAADRTINVAYSEANLAAAAWVVRTVLSQAAVHFEYPDLSSDEVNEAGYVLLLVAHADDGDGDDIWFTRSVDFGNAWDAEYRIGTRSAGTDDYRFPEVRYGRAGVFHCVWQYASRAGAFDAAVRHRRALNEAAAGIADWDPIEFITSTANGFDEYSASIAASHGSDQAVLAFTRSTNPGNLLVDTQVRASADAGATWPGGSVSDLDTYAATKLLALPGTSGFRLETWDLDLHGLRQATDAAPLVWSPLLHLTDESVDDGLVDHGDFDYDLTRGSRIGVGWARYGEIGDLDTLFFDAEWRRDPGYPNLEPGAPFAIGASLVGPPLVTELDDDPESEIVFPDNDGFVQVRNHDGTALAGWPISVVAIPDGGTVAAGDLDGDGQNEVVVGNTLGRVYAWRGDGTPLPNFPVDLGTGWDTFCSIGDLLPDSNREIVAASANGLFLLLEDGSIAPGFPRVKPAFLTATAAIGDIDDDGDQDAVTGFTNRVQSNDPTGTLVLNRTLPVGKTITNQPSLADLDLDGDLEVVVPTEQGDVYVMHHDGTDYAGWPYADASGDPITSVALAQLLGTSEPELAFSLDYRTFLKFQHGGDAAGWPHNMVFGIPVTAAPTIEDLDGGSSDVLAAALYAYGWKNLNVAVPGWPRYFQAVCEYSAASGDIDQDGEVEAIFFTPGRMWIFDTNSPVDRADPRRVWPMFGYNAGRVACLACDTDEVVAAPPGTAGGQMRFAMTSANPTREGARFTIELPGAAAVRLVLYDAAGRSVASVIKTELPAGVHPVRWAGTNDRGGRVPPGVYYARFSAAGPGVAGSEVRRIVVLP